jgi:phosphomannomutase/phosphoglucomutase
VTDLGMVPTPVFYFARQKLGIETGVMITASHNPAGDNGFKITLGPLPVTPDELAELARRMEAADEPGFFKQQVYGIRSVNLIPDYLAFLEAHTPQLPGLKVVVDCANGMAGLVARQVWAKTGAEFTLLLEDVDGRFPNHPPNPAEARNLGLLKSAVREQGADLGIAYDGDADRMAVVDEYGQPVANDKIILLFARDALRSGPQTVVYDQKCSRVVPDMIRLMGGNPVMELSGHTFIKRAFLTHQAAYAGELSGHHFFRFLGGDDGLAASLEIARLRLENGENLSEMVADLPSYSITPDIRLPMTPEQVGELLSHLETSLKAEAQITKTDGLRLEFIDGWGLVRPSVTEAAVTLRFEGQDPETLHRLLSRMESASPLLKGKLLSSYRL